MAIIKKKTIIESSDAQLSAKLFEFEKELNRERGMVSTGGRTSNPGKIKQLRKAIAQIKTFMHQRKSSQNKKEDSGKMPNKNQEINKNNEKK